MDIVRRRSKYIKSTAFECLKNIFQHKFSVPENVLECRKEMHANEKLMQYYLSRVMAKDSQKYFKDEDNSLHLESFVKTKFYEEFITFFYFSLGYANIMVPSGLFRIDSLNNGVQRLIKEYEKIAVDGHEKIKAEYRGLFTEACTNFIENDLMPLVYSHRKEIELATESVAQVPGADDVKPPTDATVACSVDSLSPNVNESTEKEPGSLV